jgi:hypothetical protein
VSKGTWKKTLKKFRDLEYGLRYFGKNWRIWNEFCGTYKSVENKKQGVRDLEKFFRFINMLRRT